MLKDDQSLKLLSQFSIEFAGDPIFWIKKSGEIFFVNQAACALLKYSKEELIRLKISDIDYRFKDTSLNWEESWRHLKAVKRRSFRTQVKAKDGSLITVDVSSNHIEFEDGEFLCGFLRDCTETIRMSTELERQKREYETIFNSVPSMIWYKDTHNKMLRVNKLAAMQSGLKPEDMEGKPTQEFYPEADKYFSDDLEVIRSGAPKLEILETLSKPTGEKLWVQTDKIPFRDESENVIGVIVISRDVTSQKRIEEELKALSQELSRSNRDLEALAYVASHDLQSPLHTVSLQIEVLERMSKGKWGEEAENSLRSAKSGVQRMRSLIRDLLDFAVLGRDLPSKESVDFNEVILMVKENLRDEIHEASALVESVQLPRIDAYPSQIVQLFQNLISNALKYRKESVPPHILIDCKQGQDDWTFSVTDNGIGIRAELHEQIFKIFQRVDPKCDLKGNGIGLASARKIVENHKGRIWVESSEGNGSTFFFSIPKK